MKTRESVFGSESEKELFKTLNTHWSQNFDLFPSLPFASIIDIDDSLLSDKERNFLYKTSVDYTLCTKRGKPLVSVEFDGLCHGFSRNGEFVQIVPNLRDRNRKLKFDLKLRLCKELGYPLFIVSYDEKIPIGEDVTLTIVDGLIGQVLASLYAHSIIPKLIKQYLELHEHLSLDENHEIVQQLIIDAEVEAEFKFDLIVMEAARLEGIARRKGLDWKNMSIRHERPNGDPKQQIRAIQNTKRVGVTVSVVTPKGEFSETAWVRNFEGYDVSTFGMAENIACLILFKNLLSGAYD
jgi:hypothetical protein